jgi:hypothetical protein
VVLIAYLKGKNLGVPRQLAGQAFRYKQGSLNSYENKREVK